MATVNIRRDVTDHFYRYKMERIQSKIEGKGNGIKTVIPNLNSIAQSLGRPPSHVIKYFGFELGAQTSMKATEDRWIINGAHEASKLQDYLDGFINRFVLCKKCKNPETDVMIKESTITLDCKACGVRTDVDPRLKLCSFILKEQPKKGKKDKAARKAARKDREHGKGDGHDRDGSPGGSNSDNGEGDGDEIGVGAGSDDELTRRINAEAKDIEATNHADNDEWAVDTSAEAVKARAEQLPDDLKRSLAFNDDDEGTEANSVYDQLGSWISSAAAAAPSGLSDLEDVQIYLKAKELGVEVKHKTIQVLAQTIFDDDIVNQIPARAGMLKKMITSEKHEKALLGGTERLVGLEKPELIPKVSQILMAYYQADLVTEDVIKSWGSKAGKKYVDIETSRKVRQSAEGFLKWLEEAESDGEEEDD